MKKVTPTIILGLFAVIFGTDTVLEVTGQHATLSETITNWIGQSTAHLIIFIAMVVLLSIHWITGKYN